MTGCKWAAATRRILARDVVLVMSALQYGAIGMSAGSYTIVSASRKRVSDVIDARLLACFLEVFRFFLMSAVARVATLSPSAFPHLASH
jgi:hypothetical protein